MSVRNCETIDEINSLTKLKYQFDEIRNLFDPISLWYKEKISRIYKNVYLASGSWIFNKKSKVNINIEHFQLILNLAPQEVKINPLPGADVFSIDLQDIYYENIYMYFETLNHLFMHRKSENILVVCAAGISRSTTVVLAYLLKQKFTLRNAISFLLQKRPQIRPNDGFLLQLI